MAETQRDTAPLAVCLMGPTASRKTEVAIDLCKRFPFEIVSVDSALVYRGMDIGTAKPDAATLARVPHHLVDIRDPEEPYSAGEFVRDSRAAMADIRSAGRVPLLVGGTMMYFRSLVQGIAALPAADPELRAAIDAEAAERGWPALHAELADVDPASATRIEANDSQRIQRALEVYRASGRTLSEWHAADDAGAGGTDRFVQLALVPEPRSVLHARIEARLDRMLAGGFLAELEALRRRQGLTADAPSMRSVGYRQFWAHLDGQSNFDEARYRALVATRQLAKRQITWLRSMPEVRWHDPLESASIDAISGFLIPFLNA